jgi:translation initiation factor 2 subunit 3
MPGDETLQKLEDASDSEEEDENKADAIPKVDVDVTKLTPLSPEVISKQVSTTFRYKSKVWWCIRPQ